MCSTIAPAAFETGVGATCRARSRCDGGKHLADARGWLSAAQVLAVVEGLSAEQDSGGALALAELKEQVQALSELVRDGAAAGAATATSAQDQAAEDIARRFAEEYAELEVQVAARRAREEEGGGGRRARASPPPTTTTTANRSSPPASAAAPPPVFAAPPRETEEQKEARLVSVLPPSVPSRAVPP